LKTNLFTAVSAVSLGLASAPSLAQHASHGDMAMPMPTEPSAKKPAAKKPAAKKPAPESSTEQSAHDHSSMKPDAAPSRQPPAVEPAAPAEMDHSTMDHGAMTAPSGPSTDPQQPVDHSAMMPGGEHSNHAMEMTGALGPYAMAREASGSAWQPDTSEHMGVHVMSGDWTIMGHGVLNLVYDHQSGRRGDDKVFASGMLMGMARRPIGDGTLQFRAALSPDPLMGKKGYPLLLASGETANGVDRLIDRQHPHDFFMELSASVSQNLGTRSSAFLYAALPGEPAFGPPAFMHREAIMDSPEAPISHHWLDSTHISFGVLTAGFVHERFKFEVSRFNGREPDQHRWDIETGALDSTAARASWNPTRTLSLQGSWGHFEDPEQLEPGVDQRRWSASALWADEIASGWKAAATLAWGRKSIEHHGERLKDDAYVAEASLKHGPWTAFARGEMTENRELLEVEEHGPAFTVGKVSLGAVHDFKVAEDLSLGVGGLVAVNFVSGGLKDEYGGNNPIGAMGFLRLKVE
jgi:hypothetical protein